MPRSGTTWLARLLATAPTTALAGREPMNPRGRQYALAGTLEGWTELDVPTARQRRALRMAYRGCSPLVFSRYGRRQWAAPLPWTRVIMKDPFAMLSVPAVTEATGAVAVLLYRHPGAALASYRRMGWEPDLDELRPVLRTHRESRGTAAQREELPAPGQADPAEAMGRFWAALYEIALDNTGTLQDVVIVSHEEIAGGGLPAARRLFEVLDLRWSPATEAELLRESAGSAAPATGLHNFNRSPLEVAGAWREQLEPGELAAIEAATERIRRRLHEARVPLTS